MTCSPRDQLPRAVGAAGTQQLLCGSDTVGDGFGG